MKVSLFLPLALIASPATARTYTVDEINQMREAVIELSTTCHYPGPGRYHCSSESAAVYEDQLRTYMQNGTDPAELRARAAKHERERQPRFGGVPQEAWLGLGTAFQDRHEDRLPGTNDLEWSKPCHDKAGSRTNCLASDPEHEHCTDLLVTESVPCDTKDPHLVTSPQKQP